MTDWDHGRPGDTRHDMPRQSWPDGATHPYPLPAPPPQAAADEPSRQPDAFDRPYAFDQGAPEPAGSHYGSSYPWPPAPPPAWLRDGAGAGSPAGQGHAGEHAGRRWLLPAGLMAGAGVLGAAAVLMSGGHLSALGMSGAPAPSAPPSVTRSSPAAPSMAVARASTMPTAGGRASTGASPGTGAGRSTGAGAPLTLAQAQAVLAHYTAQNNAANATHADALLATVETGSSDAIDVGLYQQQRAEGSAPYPAFGPVQATYYVPGNEPADGPRWFVVQVANAFRSSPAQVTSEEYLLFTQSGPGSAWQNAIEPYLLASASAPQVAVAANGSATAVGPGTGAVQVAPGQLAAATAASLDGTATAGTATVADPGNLADRADQRRWQAKLARATITDRHTAAASADGQEFALRTVGGGALVFYTDAAEVTVTPRAGHRLRLTVPGFFSASQHLTGATVSYLEQFAAYDPPAGGGAPSIVADYSGITG